MIEKSNNILQKVLKKICRLGKKLVKALFQAIISIHLSSQFLNN